MNKILVPAHIDWAGFPYKYKKKLQLMVSHLYRATIIRKRLEDNNKWWYEIAVPRDFWLKLVGKSYLVLLDLLIEHKIVGRSHSYQKGDDKIKGRAKSHWLEPRFREASPSCVFIPCHLYNKLRKWDYEGFLNQYKSLEYTTSTPFSVYEYLRNNVQTRLSMDVSPQELEQLQKTHVVKGRNSAGDIIYSRFGNTDEAFITLLEEKERVIPVSIGTTAGRFFSPVSQMFRPLRKHLLGDNKVLQEIDIKTSQPTFIWKCAFDKYGNTHDLDIWKHEIEHGDLYLYLTGMMGLPLTDNNRNIVKGMFFESVFGPNNNRDFTYKNKKGEYIKKDGKLFRVIETYFPTIARYMLDMKNGYSIKKEEYRKFVIHIQRQETELMIGRVVRRLIKEIPHICLYTIHDSILTHEEHIQCVKHIMTEEFALLGIQPQTPIK